MSQPQIQQLIASRMQEDGLVETGVEGVQLFRVTTPLQCAPAVYEPSVVAIVTGSKEAIVDGVNLVYDKSKYLCCTLPMPVEARTPSASPDDPLLGVILSLNSRVLTELMIEMESAVLRNPTATRSRALRGLTLSSWDGDFTDSLLRLLKLGSDPLDTAVLGESRLREVYYAILKGEAGDSVRRAFGVGSEIARSIAELSTRLTEPVTIEEMATRAGMSRAVFHRKFKQATHLSPIQFVKAMRLNKAAMKIAQGVTVTEAAQEVGYLSSSQFNRDFKQRYGLSPKEWRQTR